MKSCLLVYFLLTCLLFFNNGCGRITGCEHDGRTDFLFELPVTISPAKDTFNIGDTIWIEQSFSDELLNLNYNKSYKLQNFDFKNFWTISDLNKTGYSYPDPNIVSIIGNTTKSNVGTSTYSLLMSYDYYNNSYQYKSALVIDKTGVYSIAFYSYSTGTTHITKCKNQNMEIRYSVNGKGDNNYEMMKYSKDPIAQKISKTEFDNAGGYCFYVK